MGPERASKPHPWRHNRARTNTLRTVLSLHVLTAARRGIQVQIQGHYLYIGIIDLSQTNGNNTTRKAALLLRDSVFTQFLLAVIRISLFVSPVNVKSPIKKAAYFIVFMQRPR